MEYVFYLHEKAQYENQKYFSAEFVQHVIIAKNNLGHAYLPEWDFDGIDNMIPGQAYKQK